MKRVYKVTANEDYHGREDFEGYIYSKNQVEESKNRMTHYYYTDSYRTKSLTVEEAMKHLTRNEKEMSKDELIEAIKKDHLEGDYSLSNQLQQQLWQDHKEVVKTHELNRRYRPGSWELTYD